jgi:hypothetical protein
VANTGRGGGGLWSANSGKKSIKNGDMIGDIEKIKHLFVSVKETLPNKEGDYFCLITNYHKELIPRLRYFKKDWIYDFDKIDYFVTHWLDLTKITTKERAGEIAGEAFITGYVKGNAFGYKEGVEYDKFRIDCIESLKSHL